MRNSGSRDIRDQHGNAACLLHPFIYQNCKDAKTSLYGNIWKLTDIPCILH